MARARTLPRRPIVPHPEPIVGQFMVSSIVVDSPPGGLKSVRLELLSSGPITLNRYPTNCVDLVERGTVSGIRPALFING